MVKEMEQAFEEQDETQPSSNEGEEEGKGQQSDEKAELSNRPAALLERIYPFMLSKDLNIASDLCLFGGCNEEQLDDMLEEYQMIIEVLWY